MAQGITFWSHVSLSLAPCRLLMHFLMTLNVVVDQFVVNLILPSHFHFTFSLIFLPGKCFHYFWSFMNLLKTYFRIYHHLWFFFLEHIVIFLYRLLETIILFSVNFLLFYLWPSFPFCMLGPWIQWQMLFLFLPIVHIIFYYY